MNQGKVRSVVTKLTGAEVTAPSTSNVLAVDDAAPFDPTGGNLALAGTVYQYLAADPEANTITLLDAVTVEQGDRVEVDPPRPITDALVSCWDDDMPMTVRVPHALKSKLPDGVREDPALAETVLLDWRGDTLEVVDVIARDASQSWGDPEGRGTDVGPDGVVVRDTMTVDSLASVGDVTVFGMPLLGRMVDGASAIGWLDRMSAGVIARQRFANVSSARPTGEEWGYAAIAGTCRAGRLYRVSASVEARANVAGGLVNCRLRVGTPSAALDSPIEGRVDLPTATSPTHTPQGYVEGFIGYGVDTDVDVLVTYQGTGGATPQMYSAELVIEDVGPQGSYGGGSYRTLAPAGTTSTGPVPTPPGSTSREYVTSWFADASATYKGSGAKRTDSPDLVQGYYSASGICSSAIRFGGAAYAGTEAGKTLGQAITSGATITKAEVYLYFNHWYNSAGGTARLSNLGAASIPDTLPASSVTPTVSRSGWRRGEGRWVQVPVSWFSNPSSSRGVVLGGGGSRLSLYYGRADDHAAKETSAAPRRPRLRLTYER